jgi:hypothetical protein
MLCIGVAALIVLDRPFPFVLMIREILGKAIVDSGVKILKNSITIMQVVTFRVHLQEFIYQLT